MQWHLQCKRDDAASTATTFLTLKQAVIAEHSTLSLCNGTLTRDFVVVQCQEQMVQRLQHMSKPNLQLVKEHYHDGAHKEQP